MYVTVITAPICGIAPKFPFPNIMSIPPSNPVLTTQPSSFGDSSYRCFFIVQKLPFTKTSVLKFSMSWTPDCVTW